MTPWDARPRVRMDPVLRTWLEQLQASGPVRDAAIARLHAILLTEARYEVDRRAAQLRHPSGRDLAGRLHFASGALYKTLHDVRRKLRAGLQYA